MTRNSVANLFSKFSITYGVQDPIEGVPVRIVYRPRWWFQAEMLLDGNSASAPHTQGEVSWNCGIR